jgi:GT2 family glycosyltransferase
VTPGVVIATANRRERLLATLDRLVELPERPPVVVVDNGSRDETPRAVARRHPGVRVLALSRNAGSAARTLGVRARATPLAAFSDDDSWWAAGSLARAQAVFDRHPRLGLLAARVLVGDEERLDPTCERMRSSPLAPDRALPGPPVLGFIACGAVVRASAFLSVGGFHPRLGIGGEEQLVALDLAGAGWGLAYAEDVVAHHHPDAAEERPWRRQVVARNALWTLWLRRRAGAVVASTARAGLAAVRQGETGALVAALRGLPWILRERHPVPPDVDRAAGLLGPAFPAA